MTCIRYEIVASWSIIDSNLIMVVMKSRFSYFADSRLGANSYLGKYSWDKNEYLFMIAVGVLVKYIVPTCLLTHNINIGFTASNIEVVKYICLKLNTEC